MNKENTFLKLMRWMCNILQWLYWIVVVVMGILFLVSLFNPKWLMDLLELQFPSMFGPLTFSIVVQDFHGELSFSPLALRILLFASVVSLSLMAMVFRNAYLILKTADGKTWFSQGNTPFQSNVVRMIREMGIFLILICVVNLSLSIVLQALGIVRESSVEFSMVPIGCLLIALSMYFQYGVSLQKDVDGLI